MGDLQTNLDALNGQTVKRQHRVPAEVNRTSSEYLIIETEEGGRFIIAIAACPNPCPNDLLVLEEADKEDGAFTVHEALMRRRGEPLGPRPDTKGKRTWEDVTVGDARGIPREEQGETLEPQETDDERERNTASSRNGEAENHRRGNSATNEH